MNKVIAVKPLGFPWETQDPFLFCAHHADAYPPGEENLGPNPEQLKGRNIGQDFQIKDGFRMYHGSSVPGFPSHPHRGFETITIAEQGMVDHSDSLGAAGRFGNGDVQWMTAGKGVQHSEMFPLIDQKNPNPLNLFQIWLNLPRTSKFVEPHFAMLWNDNIPIVEQNGTSIKVISGKYNETKGPNPAPNSWAANPENHVWVWIISMAPNSSFVIPKSEEGLNRSIYFYDGDSCTIDASKVPNYSSVSLESNQEINIDNGNTPSNFLLLQGRPINEPVVQYGPFVMNSEAEIRTAMMDYQQTEFGGWPWPSHDHTHGPSEGRFAKYADGKVDKPD